MSAPPEPSEDHPLERYVWLTMSGLVNISEDFKGGAFKDKIHWNVDIMNCFNILLNSPLLNQKERTLVYATAVRIKEIHAALKRGEKLTYNDIIWKNSEINWHWEAMIEADAKSRGIDRIGDAVKTLQLEGKKEGEHFELVDTPAGKRISLKKPENKPGDNSGRAGRIDRVAAETTQPSEGVSDGKIAGADGLNTPTSDQTKEDRANMKKTRSSPKANQKSKWSELGDAFKKNMRRAFM
ncbi:hypothetical protein H2200_011758 [Cladophialophora chaetospira]|uniref:Uncharacterized protein n=1 Tax=Cladophialophora chaetospira TaxID=386627 RepID=A0AA38WYR5_9EURO|nr:hypothetical protein H2200_011758 [Cladophialophora chaetospira]